MSSGIWTKAMIENQKDLGNDLLILFPVSSLTNYIYIEKDTLNYSHNKYIYTMYTSPEVIQDNILRSKNDYTDYILIHKDQFDKVFNILSEAPND
jgi:hypothetical protein